MKKKRIFAILASSLVEKKETAEPMATLRLFIATLALSIATAASSQTAGKLLGSVDGNQLDLAVTCKWNGDETLEVKSHDFMMLSDRFKERPAFHASFYNNNMFMVILAGEESYKIAGRDPEGSLRPQETFDYSGTVKQQSGHDGPYDFDLTISCPK